MDNTYINIRIGIYHFQVLRDRPYISIRGNSAHSGYPYGFFAVYNLFGWGP